MISIEDISSFEASIYKALNSFLLKKYYRNSGKWREIYEVFNGTKYRIMHGEGSCIFIVIFTENNRKMQFTCKDVSRRIIDKGYDINNLNADDIQRAVNEICEEKCDK